MELLIESAIDRLLQTALEPLLFVFQSGQRIYWVYLATAALLALIAWRERRAAQDPETRRGLLGYLFPRAIWTHIGTRNDAVWTVLNHLLLAFAVLPFVLSSATIAKLVEAGAGRLIGEPRLFPDNPIPLAIGYTCLVWLGTDFGNFLAHMLQHRIPLLWEFHKVHHSAEVMTPLTVYRMHPVDHLFAIPIAATCAGVVAGLFGAVFECDLRILTLFGINGVVAGFYLLGYNLRHSHVWLDYGPRLDRWLISPAQHQIHHSRDPKHFDRNFGFMFAFWDRLAGSLYVPDGHERIAFGLGEDDQGRNQDEEYRTVTSMFIEPFRGALRLGSRASGGRGSIIALILIGAVLALQLRGLFAPATSGGVRSERVQLETLTWPEVDRLVKSGWTRALLPTGGVEQNGPHLVLGKHNYVIARTSTEIARALGETLVAPTVSYVPEGDITTREGHMAFAGTLSVPEPVFEAVLDSAIRSLAAHGFKSICLIGDSGGNQASQQRVAARLDRELQSQGVRVFHIGDYYSANGQTGWLEQRGESRAAIGSHAGIRDSSELMAAWPEGVRRDRLASSIGKGFPETGVVGDPRRASRKRGEAMIALKVKAAVAQIRRLETSTSTDVAGDDRKSTRKGAGKGAGGEGESEPDSTPSDDGEDEPESPGATPG